MSTTKDLLQFDRYLDQELSEKDRVIFELRLSSEDDFRKRFEEHRQARTDVEANFLREEMSSWKVTDPKTELEKGRVSPLIKVVLVLGILIMLAVLIFRKKGPDTQLETPQQMFADYYQPDPGLPTLMQDEDADLFMDGMVLYKIGQYDAALDKWNAMTRSSDTLSFYLAQTALAKEEWISANRYLSSIAITSSYYLEAQWFLLLTSLRENQMALTRTYLEILDNNGHRLKEIKQIKEMIDQ